MFIETSGIFVQVENDNKGLSETIRKFEASERQLEAVLQDKVLKISRLQEEVSHYQNKIDHMESVHKKEFDAQNERVCILYPII